MSLFRLAGTFVAMIALGVKVLPAQAPAVSTLHVSAVTMAKRQVLSPLPEYPAEARASGVQGVVVLRATIGANGGVDGVDVVNGDDRLGQAAKDAIRAWTYKPYLLNGEPVAVETTITMAFNLTGPGAAGSPEPGTVSILIPTRVSGGVMAGLLVRKVSPEYPSEAKAQGVSGSIVLHAFVSKTGEIENLSVISGPDLLRDSALQAVRQWTYRPYLLNGEPVAVDTQITVNFSLAPRP